jgi:hypothetical protein
VTLFFIYLSGTASHGRWTASQSFKISKNRKLFIASESKSLFSCPGTYGKGGHKLRAVYLPRTDFKMNIPMMKKETKNECTHEGSNCHLL